MRQLLKNAKIYDGTGSEPYVSDILVEDDRIAKIAANIEDQADKVIDLTGKSIASGFADRFMIKERGYLKEGYFADQTVFDEEKVRNGIPDQEKAFGIEKVFINGQLVMDDDKLDEKALKTTGRAMPVL